MSRYDTTNSAGTSPALMEIMNKFNSMPRGAFNLTRQKKFDVDPYLVLPFEIWPMLPNSDIDVNYDVKFESVNPTIKRLQSSMSSEIYVGHINYNDLWEGWNNFITGGRTGKVVKTIPRIAWTLYHQATAGGAIKAWTSCLASSPSFLMNIAPCAWIPTGTSSDSNVDEGLNYKRGYFNDISKMKSSGLTGITTVAVLEASKAMYISALPFVAYVKMVKKFKNQNLLQNYPHWLPENENHELILPYDDKADVVTNADYENCNKGLTNATPFDSDDIADENSIQFNSEFPEYPILNRLYHCDRKNDYFSTGSPFPELIRGDIPFLDLAEAQINDSNVILDFSEALESANPSKLLTITSNNKISAVNSYSYTLGTVNAIAGLQGTASNPSAAFDKIKASLSDPTISGIRFSLAQWRQLAVDTIQRERFARSDGSYNQLIESMFNWNPQWHGHEIAIVGSHKQPMVFSEVVQMSANGTSASGGTSSLGDVAGRAFSDASSSNIHIHANDFGLMIAVLIVRPDEYYNQGVDKLWSALTNAEQYFPIRNNLSPDATQNRELFVSGDDSVDLDVMNYQERFARYKSRENQVSGYMGLPISVVGDIGAYVMARHFQATPQFNLDFVNGKLDNNEQLLWASLYQNKFTCNITSRMRYVGPIPDLSVPTEFGLSF